MQQSNGQLSGIVEVDETHIGGRAKIDRKFDNMTAAIGIVERQKQTGQVRAITSYTQTLTVHTIHTLFNYALSTVILHGHQSAQTPSWASFA